MHFRDLPELDKSPLEIAQELDKQIPLAIVSRDGSDTTFATPMKFAPLAVGLHVPKSAKAIFETTRCGNVVAARMRGPIMEISMQVRKTIEFTNAFARVKVTMSKTGAEFELKNIQLL